MSDNPLPLGVANAARIKGHGSDYEGMAITIRPARAAVIGDRSGHADTLFWNFTDVVTAIEGSRARSRDSEVVERMRQCPKIAACMRLRQLMTSQLRPIWTPCVDGESDETNEYAMEAARVVERTWNQQFRPDLTIAVWLDAILDGLAVQEFQWKMGQDGRVVLDRTWPFELDRVNFSKTGQMHILTRRNVYYGEKVHPWQFLGHMHWHRGGSWNRPSDEARTFFGYGADQQLYPVYWWQICALGMWQRGLQRWSGGIPVVSGPWNTNTDKERLAALGDAIQRDETLYMPYAPGPDGKNVYDVKFLDMGIAARTPSDVYGLKVDWCDKMISQVLLGGTLLLDQGEVGTQALGRVHARTTFGVIAESDKRGIECTMQRNYIPAACGWNAIPDRYYPRFGLEPTTDTAAAEIFEVVKAAQDVGYDVSAEMVEEMTHMRRPKPHETILLAKATGGGLFEPVQAANGDQAEMDDGEVDGGGGPAQRMIASLVKRNGHVARSANGLRYSGVATEAGADKHTHAIVVDRHGNGEARGRDHGHAIRHWVVEPSGSPNHTHGLRLA